MRDGDVRVICTSCGREWSDPVPTTCPRCGADLPRPPKPKAARNTARPRRTRTKK